MKKIIWLSIGFCSLQTASVFAQDREVVIIERDSKSSRQKSSEPRRLVNHIEVFKFDPLRMAIGEINFAYERKIGDQSSFEVELGPTVSNLGRNRFTDFNGTYAGNRQPGMGVVASLGYRFYPLDGRPAFNQLYVSPKFKYRRYNEIIDAGTTNDVGGVVGNVLEDAKGFSNEAIFTFNFGYQQWLAERFSFDYYLGVGIGSYYSVTYRPNTAYDGGTNTWVNTWSKIENRNARFVATIGLKVGIGN
jgi:hypothetical protein